MSWMWLKNLFALISVPKTTDSVQIQHNYYRHSMLYLYYRKFKFQKDQTNEIRCELSWYHMAHAEPDTSSRPNLNHRHCGRLKHTLWQHGVCLYMGLHITQLSCSHSSDVLTERLETLFWTSRLGLFSDRWQWCLNTVTPTSRSRHSSVTVGRITYIVLVQTLKHAQSIVIPVSHLGLETDVLSRSHTSHLQPWLTVLKELTWYYRTSRLRAIVVVHNAEQNLACSLIFVSHFMLIVWSFRCLVGSSHVCSV